MLTNVNVLAGTEGLSVPIFPFIGVKLILGVVSYNGTGTNVVAIRPFNKLSTSLSWVFNVVEFFSDIK